MIRRHRSIAEDLDDTTLVIGTVGRAFVYQTGKGGRKAIEALSLRKRNGQACLLDGESGERPRHVKRTNRHARAIDPISDRGVLDQVTVHAFLEDGAVRATEKLKLTIALFHQEGLFLAISQHLGELHLAIQNEPAWSFENREQVEAGTTLNRGLGIHEDGKFALHDNRPVALHFRPDMQIEQALGRSSLPMIGMAGVIMAGMVMTRRLLVRTGYHNRREAQERTNQGHCRSRFQGEQGYRSPKEKR